MNTSTNKTIPPGWSRWQTFGLNLIALFLIGIAPTWAQTDRIPAADGDFSNPGGFAGNGWSVSNGSTPNHQWIVSSGHGLAAPFAGNAAFVSNDGTAYSYTPANNSTIFFWRDVTVPAGESVMSLSFNWNQLGEATVTGWDLWQVFVAPTTVNPVGSNTHPGSGFNNVPSAIAGATFIGNGTQVAGVQTFTGSIPPSFAGTTFRLIFSWKNETGGTQPPAAIDNIRLTSALPSTFTATAQGGLWNSPGTWAGGVVPGAGNDIVIPAGSTVMVNQALSYRDITVSGNMLWNGTFAVNARNVVVNSGARVNMLSTAGAGQTINIEGNLTNNGTMDAYFGTLNFIGNASSQISGSGTFVEVGGRGIIRNLFAQNAGTFTLNQSQNITVTSQLLNSANNFVTNGRLRVDNAVDYLTDRLLVMGITAMGSGYTSAPELAANTAAVWAAGATPAGAVRVSGGHQYVSLDAVASATAPSHTTFDVQNPGDGKLWLHIGPVGTIGSAFGSTLAPLLGTQFFYNGALYTCVFAGTMTAAQIQAAMPISTTVGTAITIGGASFRCVGTPASATLNYDATNQVVRSINIVSEGTGYSNASPAAAIVGGGGTGATLTALYSTGTVGPANSVGTKATASIFTGATDTRHSAAPAGAAGNGVYSITPGASNRGWYNTVPTVGFSAPTAYNLVTAQGSGYTAVPTVGITGGTLISGAAFVPADFQVNVANGVVVSVFYVGLASKIYSVPPTISLTGGGGSGATLSWGTAWPTATVVLSGGTSGQITGINVTNNGHGYVTVPTLALSAAVATEAAASQPTARLQQFNLQWGFLAPQTTNPTNNSIMQLVPSNNRINAFVVTSGAQIFTSNIEATSTAPLPTFAGLIDMGGNNLRFSAPGYAGTAGTVGAFVTNGSVELSLPGGQATATRTFPIGGGTGATAHFVHTTGAGASVSTGGYTYTGMRVQRFNTPTGTVSPAGNITGIRGVRVDLTGTGTLTNLNGTARTMTMFWNNLDGLVSDNASIFVADATSPTGPWTIRSTAGVAGVLGATGSRATATAAPGPYANNTTMFFAWANNGFVTPPALAYNATRTTGITFNSIAPVALGGDGSGLDFFTTTPLDGDEVFTPIISLAAPGNAFTFQGLPVTGFRAHTNGFIQLDNGTAFGSPGSVWNNQMNRNDLPNVIAPFWEDLTSTPATGVGTRQGMRYRIDGSAPNRTVTVEWTNFTAFALSGPQLTFQVVLNETDNSIHFNYGNMQLYNGTQNLRWSYSQGIRGRFSSTFPAAGQVFSQAYENTNYYTHQRTQSLHLGSNALSISPEPRSRVSFTPGAYVLPPIPTPTAPANDNPASADPITALNVFPTNVAWNEPDNKPRLYTTRYATAGGPAVCTGAPANSKDVWFSFEANEPVVTTRIYASGGFIPRVQVFNDALTTEIACAVGTVGSQVDAVATGLTVGATYRVRVSHNLTGNTAVLTPGPVSGGVVTGATISDGGTNYVIATPTFNGPRGNRIITSGGGGNTFVGEVFGVGGSTTPPAVGPVTAANLDGGNDYASAPTLTIESPDWGITGEFAVVIYAPPVNDNCSGAIALTSIGTANCVTGSNQLVGITTASATPSGVGTGGCDPGADDDLYYTFTATGVLTNVRVEGFGGFNPVVQISSGSCGALVVVSSPVSGCLNATGANGVEEFLVPTTIGQQYWVRVYHAGTGFGGPGANFNICVTTPVPVCASGFNIPDASTECLSTLATSLSWSAVPFATAYDVFFDNAGGTTLVSNDQAGTTYNAGVLAADSYAYRIVPLNANGEAIGCAVRTFEVISPSITSSTPASRCGVGTVTLAATGDGTSLRWYTTPTGGSAIATGSPFTTPSISATTDFYVAAGELAPGIGNIGTALTTTNASGVTPFSTVYEDARVQYLILASELTASGFVGGNMTSLAFDVTASDPEVMNGFNIRMGHTSSSATATGSFVTPIGLPTNVFSGTHTAVAGINTFTFSTPFNWNGTDNIYVEVCFDNADWNGNSTVRMTTTSFNSVIGLYDDGLTGCSMTQLDFPNEVASVNRPNMIIDGQRICEGPRTAVTATVTPPPALTTSSTTESFCAGDATVPVSLTSPVANFDTYVWSPAVGVSGGPTGPWTFDPAANTTYTLTATEISSGCVNTATLNVTVNPLPPVGTLTFANNPVCEGTNIVLNASGFGGVQNILTQNFESGLGGWAITANSTLGSNPALGNFRLVSHGLVEAGDTYNSPGGTSFLISNSDAQGSGGSTNTQFTSPVFAIPSFATAATISFRHQSQFASGTRNIQISTDGGATWSATPVGTFNGTFGTFTVFANATASLNAFIGQSNLRIRFNHVASWGWEWSIDDIVISYTLPAISNYSWSGPDSYSAGPAAPATQTRASAQLTHGGVYSVTATNGFGCQSSANSATLNITPAATINVVGAAPHASTCEVGNVTFSSPANYTLSNANPASINWVVTDGDGVLTGGTTLSPNYAAISTDAGTTVVLTGTVNGTGACAAVPSAPVTLEIEVRPRPAVTQIGGTIDGVSTFFNELTITNDDGISTYSWLPIADLYEDPGLSIPYTGGDVLTVYAAPQFSSTIYNARATQAGCTTGPTARTVNLLPSVTDDICAAALNPAVPVTESANFVLRNLTASTPSPAPSPCAAINRDIWFRSVVPANGEIHVITRQHNATPVTLNINRPVVQIFTAINCSTSVLQVACNVDGAAGSHAYATASDLTPGSTVFIRISRATTGNPLTATQVQVAVTSGLVWTGAVDNSFGNAGNWHGGDPSALTVPSASRTAIIPISSTNNYPVVTGIQNAHGLIFGVMGAQFPRITIDPGAELRLSATVSNASFIRRSIAFPLGGADIVGQGTLRFQEGGLNQGSISSPNIRCFGVVGVRPGVTLNAGSSNLVIWNGQLLSGGVEPLNPALNYAGTVSGNIRYVRTGSAFSQYNYWSAPVSGLNTTAIGSSFGNNIYDYSNLRAGAATDVQQGWDFNPGAAGINPIPITSPIPMTLGKGFIQTFAGNGQVAFNGPPTEGLINAPVTVNGSNSFNLLGNPYPSSLSFSRLKAANPTLGTVYLWRQTNASISSSSYVILGPTPGDVTGNLAGIPGFVEDEIAAAQGFLCDVSTASTIQFTSSQRVIAGNTPQFLDLTAERTRMRVRLSGLNNQAFDIIIGFDEQATDAYDFAFDAPRMPSSDSLELFTFVGEEEFTTQYAGPLNVTKVIDLGTALQGTGSYTLSMPQFLNFDPTVRVFIEDVKEGRFEPFSVAQSYTFNNDPSFEGVRFRLHFMAPISLSATAACLEESNGKVIVANPNQSNPVTAVLRSVASGDVVSQTQPFVGEHVFQNLASGAYQLETSYTGADVTEQLVDVSSDELQSAASILASATEVSIADAMIEFLGNAQGATQYIWDFGDGTIVSNTASPVHAYMAPGVYTVTFTAIAGGCTSTATTTITVSADVTGINGQSSGTAGMVIFPNPAKETANLVINLGKQTSDDVVVRITDAAGRIVWSQEANNVRSGTIIPLEIENLANGLYQVAVDGKNFRQVTKLTVAQ